MTGQHQQHDRLTGQREACNSSTVSRLQQRAKQASLDGPPALRRSH
jgi:hypothetical protein